MTSRADKANATAVILPLARSHAPPHKYSAPFWRGLFAGVLCCITLIGIPFGLQAFKLAGISFWPVGRRVVPVEVANLARNENAKTTLAKYCGATA